jgi:transcription termination factor NusB
MSNINYNSEDEQEVEYDIQRENEKYFDSLYESIKDKKEELDEYEKEEYEKNIIRRVDLNTIFYLITKNKLPKNIILNEKKQIDLELTKDN